jgi:hypothetical protein
MLWSAYRMAEGRSESHYPQAAVRFTGFADQDIDGFRAAAGSAADVDEYGEKL